MKKKRPDPMAARYVPDLTIEEQMALLREDEEDEEQQQLDRDLPEGQDSGPAKKRSPRAS